MTAKDIEHAAELAGLNINRADKNKLLTDMQNIIRFMGSISNIKDGIKELQPETPYPTALTSIASTLYMGRKDIIRESLNQSQIMSGIPVPSENKNGLIKTPGVLASGNTAKNIIQKCETQGKVEATAKGGEQPDDRLESRDIGK